MTDLIEAIARAIAAADREDYMEDCERYDDRARGAITAIEAAGLAIVPKEPSEAMSHAGWRAPGKHFTCTYPDDMTRQPNAVWHAMIAAAPKVKP